MLTGFLSASVPIQFRRREALRTHPSHPPNHAAFFALNLLVAGFSNRGYVSASSCNSEPFTAAARPRLKSHFVGGRNGGKSAAARDSDAIELRAVPAICLAPSYRWAAGPSTETGLACDLQLHFTIALPGVPVEGAADRKRSRRPSRNSLLAHIAHFESGKQMAVLTPCLQARC